MKRSSQLHPRVTLFAVAVLALSLAVTACDLGPKPQGAARGSAQDPLVRERVLTRMTELYEPASKEAEELRARFAAQDCTGICDMSSRICDASERICHLSADYPEDDEEMQENCRWCTADCDGARVSCVTCQQKEELRRAVR